MQSVELNVHRSVATGEHLGWEISTLARCNRRTCICTLEWRMPQFITLTTLRNATQKRNHIEIKRLNPLHAQMIDFDEHSSHSSKTIPGRRL